MFNELSKLVDSFDREMMEIDELIARKTINQLIKRLVH